MLSGETSAVDDGQSGAREARAATSTVPYRTMEEFLLDYMIVVPLGIILVHVRSTAVLLVAILLGSYRLKFRLLLDLYRNARGG